MNNKWPLFTGLALLTVGIILKIVFTNVAFPILLIVTGILFKVYFVFKKIKGAEYRPGYELIVLFVGLVLFFSGIHLEKTFLVIEPLYFKIAGILLKVVFIFLFIQKTRLK